MANDNKNSDENVCCCKQCGKSFIKKYKEQKFCCRSCSVTYNNTGRLHSKETKEKISETLKKLKPKKENKKQVKIEKLIKKYVCLECGKMFNGNNGKSKFCSLECSVSYRHKMRYKDFIENNEKYCVGNYTPKAFKVDFLKEQGMKCAICGCGTEHNGKPLVFILDHIDGDASNNKRENIRLICPNCDSQLDTFKSKNKHSTRRNYWKEHIIKEILNKRQ